MVSPSLIQDELEDDGAFRDVFIFMPDWLLSSDPEYQQMVPFRTFDTDTKELGYSDHLPVYLLLKR